MVEVVTVVVVRLDVVPFSIGGIVVVTELVVLRDVVGVVVEVEVTGNNPILYEIVLFIVEARLCWMVARAVNAT